MNYLETLKNIAKNKEKRIENLVLLIVLLVIILISSKYIFSYSNKKEEKESNSTTSLENINNNEGGITSKNNSNYQTELENKLCNILSQISGISDVSVVITYSQDTKQNPIYNTKEQEKQGEKTTEKNVAYNEEGNKKTAIIETVEMPKIEGAMIVAKGASTVEMRSKIATAVSTLTNVPVYKIQVFEKQG